MNKSYQPWLVLIFFITILIYLGSTSFLSTPSHAMIHSVIQLDSNTRIMIAQDGTSFRLLGIVPQPCKSKLTEIVSHHNEHCLYDVLLENEDICHITSKPLPASMALPLGIPININTATYEDLIQLPKIGSHRAQAITLYRLQHGAFNTLDEIINVKGIGKHTLESIQPYIQAGQLSSCNSF